MSNEAPKNQNPESNPVSREQIDAAFSEVQSSVYKLSADPAFQAKCLENGIDPNNDFDTPHYWQAFADHAYSFVAKARERQGNSLRLTAFELTTATPAYVHAKNRLNQISAHEKAGKQLSAAEHAEKRALKPMASYFNGIIRNFAVDFPAASPSRLSVALANTASKTIGDPKLLESGVTTINTAIRGAQHEIALGQILSHTGIPCEASSITDDLKGFDYQLQLPDGRTLEIDAKASLFTQKKNGNAERAYTWGEGGQLILFSLARDSEFRDRFFIDDSLAAQRAPGLTQIIGQATGFQSEAM